MPEQDFDYYQAMKDQRYKELLDNQIQLDNARQRALKNTNTQLAAAGFDSSGYGQTARLGLESQYLQGLQNANNSYQNDLLQINKDQHEAELAKANDDYQSYLTLLDNAYDEEDLKNTMSKAGYNVETKTWNENSNLDETARNILEQYYESGIKRIGTAGADSTPAYNIQEAYNLFTDQNGKKTLGDEIYALYVGKVVPTQEGNVIFMKENSKSSAKYTYLIYKNGAWRKATSEDYAKASEDKKYELYSNVNSKYDYNVKNSGKHYYWRRDVITGEFTDVTGNRNV